MRAAFCEYELVGIGVKNRRGALLRFTFPDGAIGYSDCCPCIDRGDLPVKEQLRNLREGKSTLLLQQAIHFGKIDAQARSQKKNLFEGLSIPKSNKLIADIKTYDCSDLSEFTHFKIKVKKASLDSAIMYIEAFLTQLPKKAKVRLDFNHELNNQEFKKVHHYFQPWEDKIEYYEDPIAYNASHWQELQQNGAILACDQMCLNASGHEKIASTIVLKPTANDTEKTLLALSEKQNLVITSYLDHPLGQLCAAYTSAMLKKSHPNQLSVCGLVTNHLYEKTEFSAHLSKGPDIVPPEGFGFGFDTLLEKQPWTTM